MVDQLRSTTFTEKRDVPFDKEVEIWKITFRESYDGCDLLAGIAVIYLFCIGLFVIVVKLRHFANWFLHNLTILGSLTYT